MTTPLTLVIGPKKMGTSWLHHLSEGKLNDKEICFPKKWFRNYVYDSYVAEKKLLIWPYLIHDLDRLNSLLEICKKKKRTVTLILCERPWDEWEASYSRFLQKYGVKKRAAEYESKKELARIKENLMLLEQKHAPMKISIIHSNKTDIERIASIASVDPDVVVRNINSKIYETNETSNIGSLWLSRLFFRLKPFLPRLLRNITRNIRLRRLFLRKT